MHACVYVDIYFVYALAFLISQLICVFHILRTHTHTLAHTPAYGSSLLNHP